MTRRRAVAMFCTGEIGHFQRLRPLITGLVGRGIAVHVYTHRQLRHTIEGDGGTFVDLFERYPPDRADATSIPIPSRHVSFAAMYATQVSADVAATGASLVIHDTFAVIARVVATLLRLPRVNVCAGHNADPARFRAMLETDPRVKTSPECWRAVDVLRDVYGIADASPFSYVSGLSPDLNIYCEPPEFLTVEERRVFEPVAFFGSLLALADGGPSAGVATEGFGADAVGRRKVFVSFGTIVWRYFAADALRALTTLADTFALMADVRAIISLGGASVADEARAALAKPNVSVRDYVDQQQVLQEADVFVTHHGMNSTHEAINHRVPMISYPFFWDQPAMATRCAQLGVAIPLTEGARGPFDEQAVRVALERVETARAAMQRALSRAREWEQAVIDQRGQVLDRIVDLIGRQPSH